MAYILKHCDMDVVRFDLTEAFDGVVARLIELNIANAHLIPLDMKPDDAGILRWLRRRTIPSNRAYVNNFLAKQGLNEKNTKGIIDISKGLSLNDVYWVVSDDFKGTFAQYNLYTNRFSRILGELAFSGHGSHIRSSFASSPEFTTNGMLAKCWRRIKGEVILYKSGTEGAAKSGNEPYSEYLAYQIAKAMDITAIKYGLARWKDRLCSTCSLFTDINTGFIPIGHLVTEGGIRAVTEYYKQLGGDYYDENANRDVSDVIKYIKATNFAIARLKELPLCNRLIKETHAVLMQGAVGRKRVLASFVLLKTGSAARAVPLKQHGISHPTFMT